MTSAALAVLTEGTPRAHRLEVPARARGGLERESLLEWAAFAAAFLVWLLYVLPERGGWHPFRIPVASLLLVPSLLVLRPWRNCPRWLPAVACAPALGALLVAALSPYGDGGPISLSRWGYFAGVAMVTAAFARTPDRQAAVTAAVLLAGLHQYSSGWLAWWGGGDALDGPMVGTLYSANMFGSIMLAVGLAAAAVAVLADQPLRRLGWLVTPAATCGVVFSGARAAMLLLLTGASLLALVGIRIGGLRALWRLAALAGVSWAVVALSTSSLFFGAGVGAFSATADKNAAGQTLDSTSSVRVDFWAAAWGEFLDEPVMGGGSGSYAGNSRLRMTPAAERSPFAHNEVLGSLAEGGLTLGLPVLVLFVSMTVVFSRRLFAGLLTGRPEPSAVARAASLAGGALIAHSQLDFALSFGAILALLAMVLGLCAAPTARDATARDVTGMSRRLVLAAAGAAVVACGGYLGISHDRAGVGSFAASDAGPLPLLRDGRVIVAEARQALEHPDGQAAAAAADAIARLARLDPGVQALRIDLLAHAGHEQLALEEARVLAIAGRRSSPLLLVPYARRLAAAGRDAAAFDLLAGEAFHRAAGSSRLQRQLVDVLAEARALVGKQQPGWDCAARALVDARALAPRARFYANDRAPESVDAAACAAWAAETPRVLEKDA